MSNPVPPNFEDIFGEDNDEDTDDLLGRCIAMLAIFFASLSMLAVAMCMVRRHSGRSPHPFLPAWRSLWVRIALGIFIVFAGLDAAGAVVGFLSLRPLTVDMYPMMTTSSHLSAVAGLFEHAVHALLLVVLVQAVAEGVRAADEYTGTQWVSTLPAGIRVAAGLAGFLVVFAVAVFGLDVATLVQMERADDFAATKPDYEKTADETSEQLALYERAAELDLARRRLEAALSCLFLVVSVVMVWIAGVVAVGWRRKLGIAHKPATLVFVCCLVWVVRNVWTVVESFYLEDVNERYYTELPTLKFRSTVDALLNPLLTCVIFSMLAGLGMKKGEVREVRQRNRPGHRPVTHVEGHPLNGSNGRWA